MVIEDLMENLRERNLKATPNRISILEVFLSQENAIPQSKLTSELPDMDRVTLYRSLQSLEESGIIHQAGTDEREKYFALCPSRCSGDHHEHKHLHFKCTQCTTIYCLDVPPVVFNLPKNFVLGEINLQATGVCANCN